MRINYSFIIPHKNNPGLLQRCVDSIPVRDDVQIIVVDDNSDIGQKPSLKEGKNLQVIYLDATNAKGAGRARNVGIEHAEGKWLLFADADDYYKPDFIAVLDNYINTVFDVVYFNAEHRDGVTGEKLDNIFFMDEIANYNGSAKELDTIRFHHNVPWTKMVSAKYVRTHNLYFEETVNGNDILFSMMVAFFTKNIGVEKTPIYVYLKNRNSILTSKETVNSAFCRFTHLVKLNHFYDFVGHPEWKHSVTKRIIKYMLSLGIPFVLFFLRNSIHLFNNRKEWSLIMSRHQSDIVQMNS